MSGSFVKKSDELLAPEDDGSLNASSRPGSHALPAHAKSLPRAVKAKEEEVGALGFLSKSPVRKMPGHHIVTS